ncbi:zinc finger protein 157-like [Frankliniella occidentalis]|uniref:Zinc finger protein 157-like n=1 Tax=Frankliniella occidentalis TaxID=133901 RepID=A0A9C6UEK2_FRAOC|nr:zinc finger protein 157-like [Frankliniella occidentalis]
MYSDPAHGEFEIPERLALTLHCPQPADPVYDSDVDIGENKIAVLEECADRGDGEQVGLVVSGCFSLHSAEGDAGSDGGHEDDGALEQHPQDGGQEAAKDRSGSGDQEESDSGKRVVRVRKRRNQSGKKTYKCRECGKRYSYKDSLDYHVKTHTGEKPFECDVCNKRFIMKASLALHVRTHTGEKPYECDDCNMRFSRKDHLSYHIRTHTGEKPYGCNICKHCFSNKSNLLRHKKTHRNAADL